MGGLLRRRRQVGGEDVEGAAQGGFGGEEIVAVEGFQARQGAPHAGGEGAFDGVEQPFDETVRLGNQVAAQWGEGGEIHAPSIGMGLGLLRKCLWNSRKRLILLGVGRRNWLHKWCVYGGVSVGA